MKVEIAVSLIGSATALAVALVALHRTRSELASSSRTRFLEANLRKLEEWQCRFDGLTSDRASDDVPFAQGVADSLKAKHELSCKFLRSAGHYLTAYDELADLAKNIEVTYAIAVGQRHGYSAKEDPPLSLEELPGAMSSFGNAIEEALALELRQATAGLRQDARISAQQGG